MKTASLKILQTGLLSVFILSPIFFGSVHAWAFLSLGAFLFLLLFLFPESFSEFRKLPIGVQIPVSVILGYVLAQKIVFSWDPWATQLELLKWLACGTAFLTIQRLPESSRLSLLKAAAVFTLFEALYGLAQTKLGYHQVLWRAQESHQGFATGTFFNRNHLAGLLEMGMGVQVGFLLKGLTEKNRPLIYTAIPFLLISFAALVETGSRMGLAAFLISVFLFCFLLKTKSHPLPFSFVLFGVLVLALGFLWGKDALMARLPETLSWEQSGGGRQLAWRDTLKMIQAHFLTGTGLGTYEWAFPLYQSSALMMKWNHAHNDYLELIAGLGIPAFLIWSFAVAGLIVRVLNESVFKSYRFSPLAWGTLLGLFSFLMHGLTDFNWAIASHALWFFMLLSAISYFPVPEQKTVPNLFFQRLTQAACFLMIALSIPKAWAGAGAYASQRALLESDFSRAVHFAEKGLKADPQNTALQLSLVKSAYEEGLKEQDELLLKKAENASRQLTEMRPFIARSWMYLALSQMALGEKGDAVRHSINKAIALEPAEGWVAYRGALALLETGLLDKKEEGEALEKLRASLQRHFQDQASPHLAEALEMLWKKSHDLEPLIHITPKEFPSYQVLLGFIEENQIWKYRDTVMVDFLRLREEEILRMEPKAWEFLNAQKASDAFAIFQKIHWMDQSSLNAKMGMLLSGEKIKTYSPDEAKRWLSEILQQEEEPLRNLEFLGRTVKKTGDPYLEGLWAYRIGRGEEALKIWAADPEMLNKTRRERAEIYQKLGRNQEALEILQPVLKESNPDYRELLLLKKISSKDSPAAGLRLKEIAERQTFPTLHPFQETLGVWTNLAPGKSELSILLKTTAAQGAYVRFYLWEGERFKEIGSAFISTAHWKRFQIPFTASGGLRLLTADIAPGTESSQVQFGPLKISAAS